MYEQWTIQMADDICSKKNDVMQQRKMHLGKDSTKRNDGRWPREKIQHKEITKLAIIFPQSQLHLQKKKKVQTYKHI